MASIRQAQSDDEMSSSHRKQAMPTKEDEEDEENTFTPPQETCSAPEEVPSVGTDASLTDIGETGTVSNLHTRLDETKASDAQEHVSEESSGRISIRQDGLDANAEMTDDGRIRININETSRKFSQLVEHLSRSLSVHHDRPKVSRSTPDLRPPKMNVVIQVVGSRGDVQPFVALGKVLKEQYHHRVRLATHATFQDFVEGNGLEFFSIGGDPTQLMAFMVKNPSLMPGFESIRHGDVGKRQHEIFDILLGCWRSCIEAGDGMDTDFSEDDIGNQPPPFVADVIIANPPSFAHIHCAEKLGIPVHLMFTMPWSPTHVFPHPLANVQSSNTDPSLCNLISYGMVEGLTWQGLGHVINNFRRENLRLEPIPYTYCWSPALIPKPNDWGQHISIAGFYFLSLASSFTPDPALLKFLDDGPAPVYIGFGSIVVDDPDAMTNMIFTAVKKAGVRALVSKGWGGLGKGDLEVPDEIFMLGNIPHDWLFQRVSCVVHHGGAGTTAAGIALGRPTVIVPFFGDQPFWGAMIARAGAGPSPVPYKKLTADILAASITNALKPSVKEKAAKLAASIAKEKGTDDGARFFHSQLDIDSMRCSLASNRIAVWRIRRTQIRLSALAATILRNEGLLEFDDLKLHRPKEYNTQSEPAGPGAGLALSIIGALGGLFGSVTELSVESVKAVNTRGNTVPKSYKTSKTPSASLQSSRTLTPTTISSTASTLIPDNPDRHHDITNSATSSSIRLEESVTPDAQDLNASELIAVPTAKQEPIRQPLSPETSRATQVIDGSSNLGRSISDANTLTNASSRPPIGSQRLEIGPARVVGRFVGGVVRSPLDLTVTLAQGFHNLPKTYGDRTVRAPDKVTDLQSGVKMAGKELGYGFYDGITGIVTHPIDGAKGEGLLGFAKGVGKGFVGVISKPVAAILGVPAYTYKGIYKELRKSRGKPLQEFIIAARTAEGLEDWTSSTAEEREQILSRWHEIQPELKDMPSRNSHSSRQRQGSPHHA